MQVVCMQICFMQMTTVHVLVIVAVFLNDCHSFDPLTSQPTLTSNVTFPNRRQKASITVSSMVVLPGRNKLLVGINTIGDNLPLTLISLDEGGSMETLDELKRDVTSLALLSNGEVVMTDTLSWTYFVSVINLEQEPAEVVRRIHVGREYSSCCHIVGAGPSDTTFLLVGYNHLDPTGSFIDLMSSDGEVIDTLIEGIKMLVDHVILHNRHVCLSGVSLAEGDEPASNLLVFNLDTRILSHHIGSLNLADFGTDYSFYQGGFDEDGNLFIATHNSEGCYPSMNFTETCCRCVMMITPEGNARMFVPPENSFPPEVYKTIQGVVMTPSGIAVAWELRYYWGYKKGMIQFYDLV